MIVFSVFAYEGNSANLLIFRNDVAGLFFCFYLLNVSDWIFAKSYFRTLFFLSFVVRFHYNIHNTAL